MDTLRKCIGLALVVICGAAFGQQKKIGPDRTELKLEAAHAALRALDVYSTHRIISQGGHEEILPAAIANHTSTMIAYSAGAVGLDWYVAHRLGPKHRKLAHWITAIDATQVGVTAVSNLLQQKPGQYTGVSLH